MAGPSRPARQDHNLAFLNGEVDRRTISPDRVQAPASPYVLQAGAVIPAALITGLAVWAFPLPLAGQVGLFAVLAIAAVFAGRRWLIAHPVVAADARINARGARPLGGVGPVPHRIPGRTGRGPAARGGWPISGRNTVKSPSSGRKAHTW